MWRTPQTAASVKLGRTAVLGRSSAPSVPSTLTPTRARLHAPHVLLTSMLVSCLHYTIKPVQTEPPSNHANSSVYRSDHFFRTKSHLISSGFSLFRFCQTKIYKGTILDLKYDRFWQVFRLIRVRFR